MSNIRQCRPLLSGGVTDEFMRAPSPPSWLSLSSPSTAGLSSDGLQLHAAGLPEHLFTDGVRLGWADRAGLYATTGAQDAPILFLPLRGVLAVTAVSPERWIVVTAEQEVWWGAPGEGWSHRALPDARWRVGGAWLLGRRGMTHAVQTVTEGALVEVPVGSRGALPLPDRAGLVWAGAAALYQLDGDGRVRVLDALPHGSSGLLVGPGEAVLVQTRRGVLASTSGRLLVPLEGALSVSGARVSADGQRGLLPTEDGCALYDLRSGQRLASLEEASPVGFLGERALVLDDAHGVILDGEGAAFLEGGFLPSPPLLVDTVLYGPAGAAWDLEAGERLWESPALSAEALAYDDESSEDEALLFALHEDEVVILDAETGEDLGAEPREPSSDEGSDGDDLPEGDVDLPEIAAAEGLPVEHSEAVGGRLWMWSDEGLLLSRPQG